MVDSAVVVGKKSLSVKGNPAPHSVSGGDMKCPTAKRIVRLGLHLERNVPMEWYRIKSIRSHTDGCVRCWKQLDKVRQILRTQSYVEVQLLIDLVESIRAEYAVS